MEQQTNIKHFVKSTINSMIEDDIKQEIISLHQENITALSMCDNFKHGSDIERKTSEVLLKVIEDNKSRLQQLVSQYKVEVV